MREQDAIGGHVADRVLLAHRLGRGTLTACFAARGGTPLSGVTGLQNHPIVTGYDAACPSARVGATDAGRIAPLVVSVRWTYSGAGVGVTPQVIATQWRTVLRSKAVADARPASSGWFCYGPNDLTWTIQDPCCSVPRGDAYSTRLAARNWSYGEAAHASGAVGIAAVFRASVPDAAAPTATQLAPCAAHPAARADSTPFPNAFPLSLSTFDALCTSADAIRPTAVDATDVNAQVAAWLASRRVELSTFVRCRLGTQTGCAQQPLRDAITVLQGRSRATAQLARFAFARMLAHDDDLRQTLEWVESSSDVATLDDMLANPPEADPADPADAAIGALLNGQILLRERLALARGSGAQPGAPALFGSDIDAVDPLVASTLTRVWLTADQVGTAAPTEPATPVGLEGAVPSLTVPAAGAPTVNVVVHCPVLAADGCAGVLEVFRQRGGAAIGAAAFAMPSGRSGTVKVPLKPAGVLALGLAPGVSAPIWARATTTSGTSTAASAGSWTIAP